MKIAVTGASGQLGSLVLDRLSETAPANELVAIVRTPEKGAHLAARGIEIRCGDYSEIQTLAPALAGVNRLLLVSGSDLGNRVAQHRAVIEAAKATGVELVAYTSVLRADTSTLPIAGEHKETEELLHGTGIPYVILRAMAGPSRITLSGSPLHSRKGPLRGARAREELPPRAVPITLPPLQRSSRPTDIKEKSTSWSAMSASP